MGLNASKHIYFYYALKIFTGIMSLATTIFFINYAGQSVYGEYALIVSVVFAFNNTFSGWISQIILKFYNIEKINRILQKFLLISIFVSLLLGLSILTFYSYSDSYIKQIVLRIFFIGIFFFSIYSSFLQKNYRFKTITFLETTRTLILFLVPLIAIFIYAVEPTVSLLLVAVSLSYIIPLFLKLLSNINLNKVNISYINDIMNNVKKNKRLIKIYLSYGLPIGLWLGVSTMLNVSDRYIIEYYYTYMEVGIYSSIYDIVYKVCTFALAPILAAIHPLTMSAYNNKTNDFGLIIIKALKLELKILPFLVFIVIVLSFFSNQMIGVSFNNFLLIAIPVLFGAFMWNFSMILHKPLEIQNKTLKMLWYIIIALGTNILGNFIFIPVYGYIVAAFTTIVSFLVYIFLVYKELKYA